MILQELLQSYKSLEVSLKTLMIILNYHFCLLTRCFSVVIVTMSYWSLQTEDDILLRNELEEIASNRSDSFKLWYTVDRPSSGTINS